MSRDFFDGTTPPSKRVTFVASGPLLYSAAEKAVHDWKAAFEGYRLQDAAAAIRGLLGAIDAEITATEPWKIMKAEGPSQRLSHVLYDCLESLRIAACLLAPIAPRTAAEVMRRIGIDRLAEDVRDADFVWGGLPTGAPLPVAPPLFPRADAKEYFASRGAGSGSANKESSVASDNVREDASKGVSQAGAAAGAPAVAGTAPAASPAAGGSTGAQTAPDASGSSPSKNLPSSSETKIPIEDFLKLDLRVGEVIAAEKVEKSKKLMKMTVKIGEETRTIVGGIAAAYTPEQLVGKKFVFVANLAPAKLMGVESNGMILAATLPETGAPSLLMVDPAVPSGAKVK
jgi:methionyl-tRNA synthetase